MSSKGTPALSKPSAAAVKWYGLGFAIGANGGRPTKRKGRPRLRAMIEHWQQGIRDGAFARTAFVGAYAATRGRRALDGA